MHERWSSDRRLVRHSPWIALHLLNLWFLIATSGIARAQATFQYADDPYGRFEIVWYPSGNAEVYNYIGSGYLLSITRSEANQLAVLQANEIAGPVGSNVTLYGTDFCSNPIVTFNETRATVVSSTSTHIVAKVPSGATSGQLNVSCGSNHAAGPDFRITKDSGDLSRPGVTRDLNSGLALPANEIPALEEAALRGSGTSAFRLSQHYGYVRDHLSSSYWLTIAAEDGDPVAMHNLAYQLLYGRDPKEKTPRKDEIRARFWLERAVQQGSGPSRDLLREMGNRGL